MQPHLPPRRGGSSVLLLAAFSLAACGSDAFRDDISSDDDVSDIDAGNAVTGSDTDAAPAEATHPDPVEPIDSLIAHCGNGALRSGAPVMRAPFVQQVTTTSAIIGWGATTDTEQHVDVTTPAGELLMSASATVENTVLPMPGMRQRWATITGLEPDTVYCYSLATGYDSFTVRAGFRTAPPSDPDRTIRFVALGDSGTGNADQRAVFEQMRRAPQELIIHVGDVAYYSGTAEEFHNRVFGIYAPLLRFVPMYPVAGNHEYVTADAAPFRDAFSLPNNERWYSFDWGNIHFAAIDTEVSLSTQAAWLDADLAATDKPWKIVFSHRPPYSSGDHGSSTDVRAALAPVMERHGVQLMLTGHDHNYERIKPQNGVTYVVTGGGGGGLRPVGTSEFTAHSVSKFHFVQFEVDPDRLVMHAIDTAGVEFDTVEIPRQ